MKRKTKSRAAPFALSTLITVFVAFVAFVVIGSSTAAPVGAAEYTLYAGQNTDVGTVYVWNDATKLYVEIDLDGWCMTESHVAVASDSTGIPQTKTGNPIPGKFAQSDTYVCAGGDTFEFMLSGFDVTPVVAVHLKVWDLASGTSMWVYSDGGNTQVTATTASPAGKTLPFDSVDAWEAFGDPADPTASTWDNGVGTSTFQHADWIWQSYRVQTPAVDETVTFKRTFSVPGPVAPGSWMKVTTDDAYAASLNGTAVASDTWPNWTSVESASPFAPVMGGNTLLFVAMNSDESYGTAGTIDTNPGGLIYEAMVNYYAHSESAWAGTGVGTIQFDGANWATHFGYTVVDVDCVNGTGTFVGGTTTLSINACEGVVGGSANWVRVSGGSENVFSGPAVAVNINPGTNQAEVTIEIADSSNYPDWEGWQIKFTVTDGSPDSVTWTWVTGPYAGSSASAVIGSGGFTITG